MHDIIFNLKSLAGGDVLHTSSHGEKNAGQQQHGKDREKDNDKDKNREKDKDKEKVKIQIISNASSLPDSVKIEASIRLLDEIKI